MSMFIAAAMSPLPAVGAAILLALLMESGWRAVRSRSSMLDRPAVLLSLIFMALLMLRWSWIVFPGEMGNPDESQFIAQAMRFLRHPVPWRDVDTNTSGPLNSMLLSAALAVGAPASWATARIVLWGTICLFLTFTWRTLRAIAAPAQARLALMPAVFFAGFASDHDLEAYSSETLPVLLVSGCVWLLVGEWRAGRTSRGRLFALGMICGAMPFTKLQAAPIAAYLAAMGVVVAWTRSRRPVWREAVIVVMGCAVAPVAILGVVGAAGALGDFWKSYVLASASYAATAPESRQESLISLLGDNDFTWHLLDAVAAALLLTGAWVFRRGRLSNRTTGFVAAVAGGFGVTLGCIILPGRPYMHYLTLLSPWLALVTGAVLFAGVELLASGGGEVESRAECRWMGVLVAAVAAMQVFKAGNYFIVTGRPGWQPAPPTERLVAAEILKVSRPGDEMSVWGWAPAYYVQTGLPPATRDAISHYVISEGPYREYFRRRYLGDLERSRPAIFVDAIGSGVFLWNWPLSETHESFPELAAFIDATYTLRRSVSLMPEGKPVRLYVLKEIAAEPAPAEGKSANR
jgi:hypothetical protein